MFRFLFVVSLISMLSVPALGQTTAADADFDGSGVVDIPDFLQFVNAFGSQTGDANFNAKYDLDGSGTIDIPDFLAFVDVFGQTVKKEVLPQKIYWASAGDGKIRRANMDGTQIEDVVTDAGGPDGLALDASGGKVYWTDRSPDWATPGAVKIRRANLDGSQIEGLVTSDLSQPIEVAVDVSAGKVYWIDHSTGKVQRANLDGSQIEDVITGVQSIHALALDVSAGKMYWGTTTGKIWRANLDGSQVKNLVNLYNKGVHALALDVSGGKMYWVWQGGTINRANLDGSQVQTLVTGGTGTRGIALDVSQGKMYWTNYSAGTIYRANLDGSQVEDVITGLHTPRGIALDLEPRTDGGDTGTPPEETGVKADRDALIALYNATDGPNWTDNTNWQSDKPLGQWYGVTMDAQGHVVALSLNQNNLDGSLSDWPGTSQTATKLTLASYPLSQLATLNLSNNRLAGAIPASLGNLANLETLDLSNNQLAGTIPPELGNLSNLETLSVSGNTDLSLPASLQTWAASIPNSDATTLPIATPSEGSVEGDRAALVDLYNATDGDNWVLKRNWLSDRPLNEWFAVHTNGQGRVVELSPSRLEIQLSGSIPASFGNLTELEVLNFSHQDLSGKIPFSLGNLTKLKNLHLRDNKLSGKIPSTLGNLSKLETLDLASNQLSGEIPFSLRNLNKLKYLNLFNNQLFGEIPQARNLPRNLENLDLAANQLSGWIPSSLEKLTKLERLNLSSNKLSGSIPGTLGNLTNLYHLYLGDNNLWGSIPLKLRNLPLVTFSYPCTAENFKFKSGVCFPHSLKEWKFYNDRCACPEITHSKPF